MAIGSKMLELLVKFGKRVFMSAQNAHGRQSLEICVVDSEKVLVLMQSIFLKYLVDILSFKKCEKIAKLILGIYCVEVSRTLMLYKTSALFIVA